MLASTSGSRHQAALLSGLDAYEAEGPVRPCQIVLRDRGRFEARIRRAWSSRIRLLVSATTLPHTVRGPTPDRAIFNLHGPLSNGRGARPYTVNGRASSDGALLWVPPGADTLCLDPGGVTRWSFSFEEGEFAEATAALLGEPRLRREGPPRLFGLGDAREARLRAALRAVMDAPGEIPRALADEVMTLTVMSLRGDEGGSGADAAVARRRSLVDGLIALADDTEGETPSLLEVCRALRAPARTLNAAASAVLGMGTTQYLRRRRLRAARATLREGRVESVTEAATRHGFWELGRFAGEYRTTFGELPSTTLRRAGRVQTEAA